MSDEVALIFDNCGYVPVSGFDFDFGQPLNLLKSVNSPYKSPKNYLKGCKWSPDGSCFLANSEDKIIRIYNLPNDVYSTPLDSMIDGDLKQSDLVPALEMKSNEMVYDFTWFPMMNSANPETCFFATTSKDTPIQLWDAYTGQVAAVYTPYNHLDELTSAYSITFSPYGDKIYAGFKKEIRVFDVQSPGRNCEERPTYIDGSGQHGIISCITVNPVRLDIYATGSYSKQIGIYEEPTGNPICVLEGQTGGITHLAFSPDGTKLFSGARRDSEILCWDMRKLSTILYSLKRSVSTHQRIHFDISFDGDCLASGGDKGFVTFWNLKNAEQLTNDLLDPVKKFKAHEDNVNGISLHPTLPLMITSSGQRRLPETTESDDEDHHVSNKPPSNIDNSIKIWMIPIAKISQDHEVTQCSELTSDKTESHKPDPPK